MIVQSSLYQHVVEQNTCTCIDLYWDQFSLLIFGTGFKLVLPHNNYHQVKCKFSNNLKKIFVSQFFSRFWQKITQQNKNKKNNAPPPPPPPPPPPNKTTHTTGKISMSKTFFGIFNCAKLAIRTHHTRLTDSVTDILPGLSVLEMVKFSTY